MPRALASLGITARAHKLWNHCWKESRGQADWVIVTEIDEHLDHPDLPGYLRRCKGRGITVVPALGYQMLSRQFPAEDECLRRTRSRGAPFMPQSKLSIFDPNAIEEIAYVTGRHTAVPTGRVRAPSRDEVVNRHYKYLGIDYLCHRTAELGARLNKDDGGLAHRWRWGRRELLADWDRFEARLVDLAAPGFDPSRAYPGPRWWGVPAGRLTRGGGAGIRVGRNGQRGRGQLLFGFTDRKNMVRMVGAGVTFSKRTTVYPFGTSEASART